METLTAERLEANEIERSVTADELEEYAKLGESVGFMPEDVTLYRLRAHIQQAGLRSYPLDAVERYLDEKFGKPRCSTEGNTSYGPITYKVFHSWGWFPLRKGDSGNDRIGTTYRWSFPKKSGHLAFDKIPDYYSAADSDYHRKHQTVRQLLSTPYNRLVPLPVLKTIADIAVGFPSVRFIVADRADYQTTTIVPSTRSEDPFLAVVGPGIPLMVIERWDEPGFRG